MPLIDTKCVTCGTITEVHRPLADYPATPSCPLCDQPTVQIHLPLATRTPPPAVVVYRAPSGSFRFPGETGGSSTAKYDRLGYTRVEARGWAEVRALEKRLNTKESSEMHRRLDRQQALRESGESARRAVLFQRMKTMSPQMQDLARVVIARNNAKRRETSRDPGLHVEVYSQDRTNREESRSSDGRRRRD